MILRPRTKYINSIPNAERPRTNLDTGRAGGQTPCCSCSCSCHHLFPVFLGRDGQQKRREASFAPTQLSPLHQEARTACSPAPFLAGPDPPPIPIPAEPARGKYQSSTHTRLLQWLSEIPELAWGRESQPQNCRRRTQAAIASTRPLGQDARRFSGFAWGFHHLPVFSRELGVIRYSNISRSETLNVWKIR